jgi:predicted ester cyclase
MREQASDATADVTLHLALVRRYFSEVLKPGSDPRLVNELFAPGIVMHRPGIDLEGIAEVKAFVAAVTDVARLETTIHDAFGADDRVVFRLSHVIEYTGDGPTRVGVVPAAGKAVTWDAIAIFRFAGGKIVEEWVARDEVAMLLQLGAIRPPA